MIGWKECALGDVLTLQRGFDITKAAQTSGPVPVVSSSGINSFHDVPLVKAPGVVVGRKGSLGTCFFLGTDFWPHDTTLWVKDFKGNDPRFCFRLLQSLDLAHLDVGSANPTLNRNHAHLLRVRVPALEEQRRIASILGAYDDLIEVNRRRVAVLEAMARDLYEEWFVRFRFPGHPKHNISRPFVGSHPIGWSGGVLGDLVELRRDKTAPGEHLSDRVYLPIECIGRRTLALAETRPWSEAQSSLQLFERGDILFGAMRAYFHKVLPAPMAGITRATCFVLRPRSPILFAFATLTLFRDETVTFAAANSKGSTIPYAHWSGSLERFPIALPPSGLLRQFDRIVRPLLDQIMATYETNRLLFASRDLLLPRLISGELAVAAAARELEAA